MKIEATFNKVIFLECANSEGLPKFAWSHDGFWKKGGSFMGFKSTALICANECTKEDTCVAINYHYSGDTEKACWQYHDQAPLTEENKIENRFTEQVMKSYMKCQGSKW